MSESKGFNCPACGTHHEFTMYVYAHWDMSLSFTCPAIVSGGVACGAVSRLVQGRVVSTVKVTKRSRGNRGSK